MRENREGVERRVFLISMLVIIFVGAAVLFVRLEERRYNKPEAEPLVVELDLVYAYQNMQWYQGIEAIAEAFEKEYKHIRINTLAQYEDRVYEDILYKRQARDELGDIIQLKTPGRYLGEGLLAPIEEKVGNLVEVVLEDEGGVYALAAIGSTTGVIYNKTLFEQHRLSVPQNYGEFLELCETFRQCGITPVGIAGGDLWHMEYWMNHFFRSDVLSGNDNWLAMRRQALVSWQDEEPVQMLTHLSQLFAYGYVNDNWELMRDGNLTYAMSQGEVAMIYSGSWTARELGNLNPELELGWFYLPDEEGQVVTGQNCDVFWAVTAACKEEPEKYQAAMMFLEFFYRDEVYQALCEEIYGFPVTRNRQESQESGLQLEIREQFLTDNLHLTEYIGNEDTPQGFEKQMLHELQAMMRGEQTVGQTAACLEQLWDEYQRWESDG